MCHNLGLLMLNLFLRALAAILENFQYQQEGSSSNGYIKIPEPLWEYMGVEVLLFKLPI